MIFDLLTNIIIVIDYLLKAIILFCHEKPVFRLVFRENQLLYVLRITFQSIVFTLFYSFYL